MIIGCWRGLVTSPLRNRRGVDCAIQYCSRPRSLLLLLFSPEVVVVLSRPIEVVPVEQSNRRPSPSPVSSCPDRPGACGSFVCTGRAQSVSRRILLRFLRFFGGDLILPARAAVLLGVERSGEMGDEHLASARMQPVRDMDCGECSPLHLKLMNIPRDDSHECETCRNALLAGSFECLGEGQFGAVYLVDSPIVIPAASVEVYPGRSIERPEQKHGSAAVKVLHDSDKVTQRDVDDFRSEVRRSRSRARASPPSGARG